MVKRDRDTNTSGWMPEIHFNSEANHRLKEVWEEYGDNTKYRYEDTHTSLAETQQMWQATADAVPVLPAGSTAIDMGTGPGFMAGETLKKSPAAKVIGMDISASFLEQARTNLSQIPGAEGRVELYQHDITKPWPVKDESAEVVMGNWVIQYHDPQEQQAIFNEAARVLKPGGQLIMNTMANRIPFGAVVGGIVERAIASGNGEGAKRLLNNMPIAEKFREAAQKGWTFHPTPQELETMHKLAGFKDFEIVTKFETTEPGSEVLKPYLLVTRSTK